MRKETRALQQRLKLTVAYVTQDQAEALAVMVNADSIASNCRTRFSKCNACVPRGYDRSG